ncbi:MAG TPA: sigma-70 family RNA polymerase sigma factor [Iamia sp.]
MDEQDHLAARFEADRTHLRAVAYRMLGSVTEAEDAVQEAWFRLSRSDTTEVANLTGWLTTVVGRVCLDMLRARRSRPEDPAGERLPDPVVRPLVGPTAAAPPDPAEQALLADSVGLALLVVLDSLAPAERLAYVLHDMFGLPFDEIAPMVDKSPAATRQLASRARRRIQGRPVVPEGDVTEQRALVDAFIAAARDGNLDRLVSILHPDVVLRADRGGAGFRMVQGAKQVARGASTFQRVAGPDVRAEPALVNGSVGVVASQDGAPLAVLAFTVVDGRIVEIDILNDPIRLATLDLAGLV